MLTMTKLRQAAEIFCRACCPPSKLELLQDAKQVQEQGLQARLVQTVAACLVQEEDTINTTELQTRLKEIPVPLS
eukprot:1518191-Pleurochrysis_carterae.AAC.5